MWTDDMVQRLRTLWEQGKTAGEIAKLLPGGWSRNAILGKAHRLGLGARGSAVMSTKDRFERVCNHVIEGHLGEHYTIEAAARLEGMKPDVAHYMWNEKIERTHGGDPE